MIVFSFIHAPAWRPNGEKKFMSIYLSHLFVVLQCTLTWVTRSPPRNLEVAIALTRTIDDETHCVNESMEAD